MLTHPQLRAKALERALAAHQELAGWLRARANTARAGQPDAVAGAILGALIGAALPALHEGASADRLGEALEDAISLVTRIADQGARAEPIS